MEKNMFCKYCGKELPNKAIFCSKCGKQLGVKETTEINSEQKSVESKTKESDTKFCKYCGAKIAISANFCSKCGQNLQKEHKNINETVDFSLKKEINTEPAKQEEKIQNHKTPKNAQKKFGIGNLFSQVFKKHTSQERNEILRAGLSDDNSKKIQLTPENLQPWLYSRVFLVLFAVFIIFEICLLSFYNTNIMPGVMLIGSVMIPFSLLTMYFELNIYKDISFYKTIGIFLLGGAASLLFTLFLYEIIPTTDEFNFIGASLISIIEELGKAVIVIILLKRSKNITVLQGLLIGGAIGCGFAAFESAGYAFNVYLDAHDYNTRADFANSFLQYSEFGYADSIGEMNFNIILRSILAFGGHTSWAAIEGAAYAKTKKINKDFLKLFAICFILHAIWDTDLPAPYLKLICLCFTAWWVIIKQISNFIEEHKQEQTEE